MAGAGMPAAIHQAQIAAILEAWGMPAENASRTAEVMAWADLHGVKSHGISMLLNYDILRRDRRVCLDAEPEIVRETPVSALVDGRGGLGYVPSRLAMGLAVDKARAAGVGIVSVRNSAHFGACGFYTQIAVEAGLIGLVTTTTANRAVAPTGGAEAKLGTDPISFGAPAQGDDYFLLDMATTTVAGGKIRNLAVEGLRAPPGWLLNAQGLPTTDPNDVYQSDGFMTSLGGSREGASYKGYGLAVMVNILSACLSGSSLPTDPLHARRPGQGNNIGHFFMALDPGLFREPDDFHADVSTFIGALRATKPVDTAEPVQVAGDPERKTMAKLRASGIVVPPNLCARIRTMAEEAGAPWLLDA